MRDINILDISVAIVFFSLTVLIWVIIAAIVIEGGAPKSPAIEKQCNTTWSLV